ncbi:hypothetical protein Ancab_040485 [Ancistrocladus abbreviatus]
MFGVEITILHATAKNAVLNVLDKKADVYKYTWPIKNFSPRSKNNHVESNEFSMGGRSWKLEMFSRGHGKALGKSLALFLTLLDSSNITNGRRLFVDGELRVKNLKNEPDKTSKLNETYDKLNTCWGDCLISLSDLHNPNKGFKLNDTLIVEVELKHMHLMDER